MAWVVRVARAGHEQQSETLLPGSGSRVVGHLDRGFAFVSILVLSLAIGAPTAVFSVVENALVEPFPYRDQRNLVVVHIRDLDQSENSRSFFTMTEIQEIRKQNSVFESIANNQQDDVISRGSESGTRFDDNFVTQGSFDFLGVSCPYRPFARRCRLSARRGPCVCVALQSLAK